ncbi:hypothetical protein GALMADRAFT_145292 [Galerina marginata CBS 339.88]|uniref:Uncharacterized protein n=1 Tax=Galerina marginata (strain CBS 339.88) TaxID=685588 RepID=A0A067SHQ7_GALM3|nr:hypothetical protein GALMADRAFT_145292 [Galerina marginata CBS 339.88]
MTICCKEISSEKTYKSNDKLTNRTEGAASDGDDKNKADEWANTTGLRVRLAMPESEFDHHHHHHRLSRLPLSSQRPPPDDSQQDCGCNLRPAASPVSTNPTTAAAASCPTTTTSLLVFHPSLLSLARTITSLTRNPRRTPCRLRCMPASPALLVDSESDSKCKHYLLGSGRRRRQWLRDRSRLISGVSYSCIDTSCRRRTPRKHSRFLAPKRIANSFMGNEFANCSHSYALFISLFSWFFEPRHLRLPLGLFEPRHPRPSLLQTSRRGYRNLDLVPVVLRAAPSSRLHLRITASVPLVQSSFQGSSSPPITFRIVRSLTPALPNVPAVVPGSVRSLTPAFTRSIFPHANYGNYFLEPQSPRIDLLLLETTYCIRSSASPGIGGSNSARMH